MGVGQVTSGIQATTGPPTVGTHGITLTVTNAAGTSTSLTLTVTVVRVPTISSFTANQLTVTSGSGTTLQAFVSDGNVAIDNGIGLLPGTGPLFLAGTGPLTATTTFTLTAFSASGTTVTRSITVTVVPPPVITSFTIGAATVNQSGPPTTLAAVFSGGTGSVDTGVGSMTSGVGVSVGPSLPAGFRVLTLTVTNAAGTSVTATVTVTVF
jgi:hypothetical protein